MSQAPAPKSDYINHPVHDRLFFAERRFNDLRNINGGDLPGAEHRDRQALVQEFFFHLGGAIDFLAQTVNQQRKLGLREDEVTPPLVCQSLQKKHSNDPIWRFLSELHPRTSKKDKKGNRISLPLPSDPYSEEGSFFRVMLYRHFVTHRTNSPFNFNVTFPPGGVGDRSANLFLDPREPYTPADKRRVSKFTAFEEFHEFHSLVKDRCDKVLAELKVI